MGGALKACSNSRTGDLEVTFLKTFCQNGNLRAILNSEKLPPGLHPYTSGLNRAYKQVPLVCQTAASHKNTHTLPTVLFKKLIEQLNVHCVEDSCTCTASSNWLQLKGEDSRRFVPVNSQVEPLNYVKSVRSDVSYSTFQSSPDNSVVCLKPSRSGQLVGFIDQIFKHRRFTQSKQVRIDTWLVVKPFPPVPPTFQNPFLPLYKYDTNLQFCLFTTQDQDQVVVQLDQILAHCAWIEYAPHEISAELDLATVALTCLDCH
ncbi:hypothetical protein O181_019347 [Austropuccinia psidii MF-1]|uniref:Uncharacterized protein n=1 Tax=Austropuccinia psidii MF-1 TaxID=1389203 RepID=A0A9Q3C9J4_9BASI|nr:hypothetical protein [Austropuccinia psidii MF-1]